MSYLGRSAKLSLKAQEKVSFLATAGQTSKTGLSYTPSFVEVYVNGVLLTDTTDFTATNGNSITFTVALLLNDEVTVISLKTFTVAEHYSKTEADTLLAAKATNTAVALKAPIASPSFTGTTAANKLNVTGVVDNTISGTLVVKGSLSANQTSGLALFQQSSTASTIKAFGPNATTTGILNTYVAASDGSPDLLITSVTANGLTFNGDTAAANALDDYEEGTYNPVAKAGSTVISTTNQGTLYTKIGRQVNLSMYLIMGSSANISSISLPFTAASSPNVRYAGAMASYNMPKSGNQYSPLIEQNSAVMGLWQMQNNTAAATTWSVDSNSEVFITITYFTDS